MTKQKTHHATDDTTTSRGTVKGHHETPGDAVTEGGHGHPKGAASTAHAAGAVEGEDTSGATVRRAEKEQAAAIASGKTQSGRGHRKHDA